MKNKNNTISRYDIISITIALFALIISFLSYQDSHKQTKFQTSLIYEISTKFLKDWPVELNSDISAFKEKDFFVSSLSEQKLGRMSLWVQVTVTNNGSRTFSIESIDCNVSHRGKPSQEIIVPDLLDGVYASSNNSLEFPFIIEPGHQRDILLKIKWPITQEIVNVFKEDIGSKRASSFYEIQKHLIKSGSALSNTRVKIIENERLTAMRLDHNTSSLLKIYVKITGKKDPYIQEIELY